MNHTLRSIYKSLLLVSVFLCLCVPTRSAAPPSDFKVRAPFVSAGGLPYTGNNGFGNQGTGVRPFKERDKILC